LHYPGIVGVTSEFNSNLLSEFSPTDVDARKGR